MGLGSWTGPGTKKGSRASMVTTQAETVVPKFLPRKGPRGTYSQAWMSRALQSFMRTTPNMWSLALSMVMGSPKLLPVPTKKAYSNRCENFLRKVNKNIFKGTDHVFPCSHGE